MTDEPTRADLARLLEVIIAMEPEFQGIPGWRLRELAQKLAAGVTDPPSPEEVAAALLWVQERTAARNAAQAHPDPPGST